jgi:hypothetical protein
MQAKALYDEFKKAAARVKNPYPHKLRVKGPIIFGEADAVGFVIDFYGEEGELLKEGTVHWRVEDCVDGSLVITDGLDLNEKIPVDTPKRKALKIMKEQWEFYLTLTQKFKA